VVKLETMRLAAAPSRGIDVGALRAHD
jgi:hypothetical protein